MASVVLCPACGREDFGEGRRCQYCTQPLAGPAPPAEAELSFDLDGLDEVPDIDGGTATAVIASAESVPPDDPAAVIAGAPPQAEASAGASPSGWRSGRLGVLATIGILLFKFKSVLLLVLTKAKFLLLLLKGGKFLTTGLSMVGTMGVYAIGFGWKFAVGFVLLIFVHEMGHVYMMWRKGMPLSAPVFIPFAGAFIALKKMPQDAATEAAIGIGGPAAGSLGGLACLLLYYATGWPALLAIAYLTFFINLFNLVPVPPLDGGRIVSAISPKLWWVGIPLLVVLGVRLGSPILWLILILGVIRVLGSRATGDYFQVPAAVRRNYGIAYFGMLAALGVLMLHTHSLGAQAGHYEHADFAVNGQAANAPVSARPPAAATDSRAEARLPRPRVERPKGQPDAASRLLEQRLHEMDPAVKGVLLAGFALLAFLAWLTSSAIATAAADGTIGKADLKLAAVGMLAGAVPLALRLAGVSGVPRAGMPWVVIGIGVFLSAAAGAAQRLYTRRPGDREAILYRGLLLGCVALLVLGLAADELHYLLPYPGLFFLAAILRNPALLVSQYSVWRYAGRPHERIRLYERGLGWPPLSARGKLVLHNNIGDAAFLLGDYATAIRHGGAAAAHGKSWMPHGNLAEALIETGDYARAAEECARVSMLARLLSIPGAKEQVLCHLHRLLAQLNARRGALDEAGTQAEKVIGGIRTDQLIDQNLRNTSIVARWAQAQVLLAGGDRAGAEDAIETALRLRPVALWRSHLLSVRAAVRCEQGRWPEAEQDAHEALKLFAPSIDARYWLARALLALGRPTEAAEHLRAGQELNPGHAYAVRCREALDALAGGGASGVSTRQ